MTLQCVLQIMVLETSGKSFWILLTLMLWRVWWYTQTNRCKKRFHTVQLHSYIYTYVNLLIKIVLPNILVWVTPMYNLVQYFLMNCFPYSWVIFHNKYTFTKWFNRDSMHNWCITIVQSSDVFLLPALQQYWILFNVSNDTWLNNCINIWFLVSNRKT